MAEIVLVNGDLMHDVLLRLVDKYHRGPSVAVQKSRLRGNFGHSLLALVDGRVSARIMTLGWTGALVFCFDSTRFTPHIQEKIARFSTCNHYNVILRKWLCYTLCLRLLYSKPLCGDEGGDHTAPGKLVIESCEGFRSFLVG